MVLIAVVTLLKNRKIKEVNLGGLKMKRLIYTIFLLVSLALVGCNKIELVDGTVNEEMTFNDITLTVKENQIFDHLVETGEGHNSEVSYGESNQALLVHITMNTGETSISNTNFVLNTGEENSTTYEALPTDLQFHEKYNVLDFNKDSQGTIDGNLLFAVDKDELKNNEFTVVATFEDVTFTVPVTINTEEPKEYTLGDTVNIDDEYEINFKKLNIVTENLKHKGSEVVLGNNKLLVLDTEITPLNGKNVLIKDQNLFFKDTQGDLYIVDTDEYDGFVEIINTSIEEKTEGHIKLLIPAGIEKEDLTFFIETPFSKTDFTLK